MVTESRCFPTTSTGFNQSDQQSWWFLTVPPTRLTQVSVETEKMEELPAEGGLTLVPADHHRPGGLEISGCSSKNQMYQVSHQISY